MANFDKPLPRINITLTGGPEDAGEEDLQKSIDSAYKVNATFQNAELSKGQQRVDNLLDKVIDGGTRSKSAYDSINSFYTANQAAITAAGSGLANLTDTRTIDSAISSFVENSQIVIKGLDALGQLHPFIGVAVTAFKLVISLDLTRRQNNKKVIALKIQMQETMTVLFDLRHMKDPEQKGPDGTTIQDRMSALLEKIAKDIKETGSECDHYLKKGFLAKTVKAMKYEARLAAYGDRFIQHRKDLKFALSVHTALGVDAANAKLDDQSSQMRSMEQTMQTILRKLDSHREREAQELIEKKGGVKACLENDQLLGELIEISGEGISGITSYTSGDEAKDLAAARKKLLHEYSMDLDEALKRNMVLFERKLEIQNKQIKDMFQDSLHEEGEHIISVLKSGAHDRILDADMQAIWKDMEWKGSVKARHFVLALQDYYTDMLSTGIVVAGASAVDAPDSPNPLSPVPISPTSTVDTELALAIKPQNDRWALQYLNVAHVQPILEAIDDDGTGFISIKEVNHFVVSKPPGWSLPTWIAYWAAGWHTTINRYKNKIYALIRRMNGVISYEIGSKLPDNIKMLPSNRIHMDEYLFHETFHRIELLLRSTRPVHSNVLSDGKLRRFANDYTEMEERRLEDNLDSVKYDIDTAATVALITGPGRIERFIFPLLYLILKRHLKVFYLAQTHVLDAEEFLGMSATLQSLFNALDDRIEGLGSIFRQTTSDVREKLENFSFGLLQLSYGDHPRVPKDSTLLPWSDRDDEEEEDIDESQIPLDILRYGIKDTLESRVYKYSDTAFTPSNNSSERCFHPLQGYWAGHLWVQDWEELYSSEGLFQIQINDFDPATGKFSGVAETYLGAMTVTGSIAENNVLSLTFVYEDHYRVVCEGRFDPDTDIMSGSFADEGYDSDSDDDDDDDDDSESEAGNERSNSKNKELEEDKDDGLEVASESGNNGGEGNIKLGSEDGEAEEVDNENGANEGGESGTASEVGGNEGDPLEGSENEPKKKSNKEVRTFLFNRTPAFAWRYHTPSGTLSTSRERWKFACAAILEQVRCRMFSWTYLKERGAERRRFLELSMRREVDRKDYSPSDPLSDDEGKELRVLQAKIHPTDARFYQSAIDPMIESSYTWHLGYECDSCDCEIIKSRFICLTCISDDFSDTIDLCLSCRDTTCSRDNFNHQLSHPLLKVDEVILDGELAYAVPEARVVSNRVKALLKSMGSLLNRIESDNKRDRSEKTKHTEALCCCCRKAVSAPCWACLYCSPDSYICDECESKRVPALSDGPAPWHELKDHLIRIHDNEEIPEAPTTESRLVQLETKLAGVEVRFQALEDRVEARFTALEGMLQEILASIKPASKRE